MDACEKLLTYIDDHSRIRNHEHRHRKSRKGLETSWDRGNLSESAFAALVSYIRREEAGTSVTMSASSSLCDGASIPSH